MVKIAKNLPETSISVDEFMAQAATKIDVRCHQSLHEHANLLQSLSHNRDFLLQKYNDVVAKVAGGERSDLTPSSIIISKHADFVLRANIWLPLSPGAASEYNARMGTYQIAHDHAFNFSTVNYFGSGYVTDLYEYDGTRVHGYIDEAVDLKPQGSLHFTHNQVVTYAANKDVHIQHPPSDISISLNILETTPESQLRRQLEFDVSRGVISGGASDWAGRALSVIDFLKYIHNDNTVDLLWGVIGKVEDKRIREHAADVLHEIAPDQYSDLLAGGFPKLSKNKNNKLAVAANSRGAL